VAVDLSDPQEARSHFLASLGYYHELGHDVGIVEAIEGLACAAAMSGDGAQSALLLGSSNAARISNATSTKLLPADEQARIDRARKSAREQLGPTEYERVSADGAALPIEAIISRLLSESRAEAAAV
jgi:hypothetical protein